MKGLYWLERDNRKILCADYSSTNGPIQLLHAFRVEQHRFEDSCVYSLVNLNFINFSESFIKEYIDTAQDVLQYKKSVSAYIKISDKTKETVDRVFGAIPKDRVRVEFFETEPAALGWLLSFQKCEN
jgi:hypothetical protein